MTPWDVFYLPFVTWTSTGGAGGSVICWQHEDMTIAKPVAARTARGLTMLLFLLE